MSLRIEFEEKNKQPEELGHLLPLLTALLGTLMIWCLNQYLKLYKKDKYFCFQFVGTSCTEDLKQVGWNTISIRILVTKPL